VLTFFYIFNIIRFEMGSKLKIFLLQPLNVHFYITTVSLYITHTPTCVLVWCTC